MNTVKRLTIGLWVCALGVMTLIGGLMPADNGVRPVTAATGKADRLGIDPIVTAGIGEVDQPPTAAQIARNEHLLAALDAIDSGDVDAAFAANDQLGAGTPSRDLADWAIAMSTDPAVPATHIAMVQKRLADWPGQTQLARNHERALTRGWLSNIKLQTAFAATPPETFEARYALAKMHLAAARTDTARALIADAWRTNTLWASVEREIIDLFADVLTREDHRARHFNMMVRERVAAAERVADVAGMRPLQGAWAAVIGGTATAGDLIAQVPDALLQTEAGLYMQVEHLRRTNQFDEAARLLATVASDPDELTNADAWWNERRIVSRSLREAGDNQTAYQIVAAHRGGRPTTQVDAAFHAGWYALRGLNDPARAADHFAQIEAIARGAASRARGAYWLGRTARAAGDEAAAQDHFARAAEHPTVFYGQLAARLIGRLKLEFTEPTPDAIAAAQVRARPAFGAIEQLQAIGNDRWPSLLYRELAEQLDTPAEIAFLARHAAENGHHFSGLRMAKRAAWNGLDVGLLTHPVGAIPGSAAMVTADRALAYAIARQESEFNSLAVSRADARGLLQILPSTARQLAARLELPYSADRLTADPAFNAVLGTHYLDEQRNQFGGSYVLTFVAYNAGPGRAQQWIDRFGDPRGLDLEATIDWIEQIPFPETRTYVQKVMENLTVYKARFGMDLMIEQDLTGQSI